jgi:signal transduction histidine kinase
MPKGLNMPIISLVCDRSDQAESGLPDWQFDDADPVSDHRGNGNQPAIESHEIARRSAKVLEEAKKMAALAERSRIAHDLHDSLVQCLSAIYMQLEAAARLRQDNSPLADACIDKAQDLSRRTIQEVRRVVAGLQPDAAQYCDLAASLEKLADDSSANGGTRVVCVCHQIHGLVPPEVGYELFHIAREAIGNALRYAGANQIVLRLRLAKSTLELSIVDDGAGFRPGDRPLGSGFGFTTMKKRAERIDARLRVESSLGAGTSVHVSVRRSTSSNRLCVAHQSCV